jgi:hypothetical protein
VVENDRKPARKLIFGKNGKNRKFISPFVVMSCLFQVKRNKSRATKSCPPDFTFRLSSAREGLPGDPVLS